MGVCKKRSYVMLCAIWYNFHNLKMRKRPMKECYFDEVAGYFTKSNTPQWVFFMYFKLYKRYQIAQSITYISYIFRFATRHWHQQRNLVKHLKTGSFSLILNFILASHGQTVCSHMDMSWNKTLVKV